MKKGLFIIALLIPTVLFSQKAIFLHHSTGNGVWKGGIPQWISDYNAENGTNFSVTERSYPNTPYPWENYPYDFWNLWVNKSCDSGVSNIECINTLSQNYDLIIFKHCFPGAGIVPDKGIPNVSSKTKSLENYKVQYKALREMMDSYPDTKFMVWTLAPLHRLSTNAEAAARAKQFVDWVKTEWLTEDGKQHSNIYIFDFFNLAAETEQSPANGQVNCLKFDYELSPTNGDSHPNSKANTAIAPKFAEAIVNALVNTSTSVNAAKLKPSCSKNTSLNTLDFTSDVNLDIYNMTGQKIISEKDVNQVSLNQLSKGVYLLNYSDNHNNTASNKLLVQ